MFVFLQSLTVQKGMLKLLVSILKGQLLVSAQKGMENILYCFYCYLGNVRCCVLTTVLECSTYHDSKGVATNYACYQLLWVMDICT